jgi:alpha,alpha-trehalose phosphorylase
VKALARIEATDSTAYGQVVARLSIDPAEIVEWERCAKGMTIPFDEGLGIHPQDDFFLDREVWDLSRTPDELRPLMLHYHPLVIYRFQVLKQADVVLALFLQGDRFTAEEKRKDFEYYDPITTGDSTLSAVVQSVIAAEVGYQDAALRYFLMALYVDLRDLHGNTVDGMHVASAGGVWSALVFGFAGLRDAGGRLSFDPRLPESWPSLRFALAWHGARLQVAVDADSLSLSLSETTDDAPTEISVWVRGERHTVRTGSPVRVEMDTRGPRLHGEVGTKPVLGGTRADGTMITAGVPDPIPFDDPWEVPGLSVGDGSPQGS